MQWSFLLFVGATTIWGLTEGVLLRCDYRGAGTYDISKSESAKRLGERQGCVNYPLPERSEGSEVLKIAIRDDNCRGGATILAGVEVIQGDQLREVVQGGLPRRSLSICPLRCELVRAPWPDRDETFGGGRGQVKERLSPEPAQSAKVCAKKGGKFEFFGVLLCEMAFFEVFVAPVS